MTWIKPSFLWMMYRSDWTQGTGQERVLAIRMSRAGFEWVLEHSCLSHFEPNIHGTADKWLKTLRSCPVRVQWDPERNILLQKTGIKSIQIGLSEIAVAKYISEWIIKIQDITTQCKKIQHHTIRCDLEFASSILPEEMDYPLPARGFPQIGLGNGSS